MASLHVIFASTSGHTEYVVDTMIAEMQKKDKTIVIEKQRAETAKAEDFLRGDELVLASGSWNTGGSEGQLNPYMHAFLTGPADSADLQGKHVAVIGLGDDRYFYTARAQDILDQYVKTHNGSLLEPSLRIVNEPYGQERIIRTWSAQLLLHLQSETHA